MDNRVFQVGASATPPTPPASPSNGYPTNGDPVTSMPATQPGEFWFHQIGEELRAILVAAGVVPSTGNTAQVVEAIQRLIDAQSGNYALDTGAANAYVVALSPAIIAYADGMTIRVKAVNANTGACTLNAGGGVVALNNDVGAALVAGDIPAGGVFTATYVASAGVFYMNALVQSQGDTRWAAISQTFYIGTTQVTVNRASGAITLNGVSIDGNAANLVGGTIAFSVYLGAANQSAPTSTFTKVAFSVEEFDTGANFDSTTNSRFQPIVAGYYQINWGVNINATNTLSTAASSLYKNGAQYKQGVAYVGPAISTFASTGSAIVYMNGTTDYLEIWGYVVGTTPVFTFGQSTTYMSGCILRP